MSDASREKAREIIKLWFPAMSGTGTYEERITDLATQFDAYADEQTAAEAAKHADCCVDRQELAALRAALNVLRQPDATRCASERCGECAACHARALLAAPEAAP